MTTAGNLLFVLWLLPSVLSPLSSDTSYETSHNRHKDTKALRLNLFLCVFVPWWQERSIVSFSIKLGFSVASG
jgi:hypothetical protein